MIYKLYSPLFVLKTLSIGFALQCQRERAACHMLHVASLVACLKCSQFLEVLAKKQLARFTVHLHCYIQRMTPMSAPLGRIFRFWQASPEQACRQWGRAQAEENEESTIAAVPFWAYCNWFLCVCVLPSVCNAAATVRGSQCHFKVVCYSLYVT